MVQDETKSIAVDAGQQGTVQTINIPAGEVWYVDEFQVAGDSIQNPSNLEGDTGIEIAVTLSDDPNNLPQESASSREPVATGETKNVAFSRPLDTYVSGNVHQIRINVINQDGRIGGGTYYVVVKSRRVI